MKMKTIKMSKPQIAVKKARTPLVLDMAGQGAGKTMNIGVDTYEKICMCPKAKGFIGANTHEQLTKTTLVKAFSVWKMIAGWEQYDAKSNPSGIYVVNRKPPSHFVQFEVLDDYRKTICFQNGAMIFTGSLKNYLVHDGKEFAWCHLDETKDTKKEAVTDVILGRLRQYGLWYWKDKAGQPIHFDDKISPEEAEELGLVAFNPCYIHTSPSSAGVEWLLDLFHLKSFESEIRKKLADKFTFFNKKHDIVTSVIYQSYWNENNLPPNFLENQKKRMSSNEQLLFIDGFPFAKTGSEYFPDFNRSRHVVPRHVVPFDFNGTFLMSMDFNVVPYVTLISSQIKFVTKFFNEQTNQKKDFLEEGDTGFVAIEVTQVFIQKEFLLANPDNETDKACEAFCEWLIENDANCDVFGYGDATGQNRIVGLGTMTQFKIIENVISKYFYYEKKVRKANPSNRLRRMFMNRILAGSYPEIEFYISEECEQVIRDFEFLKQSVDGGKFKEREKDKTTGESYEKIGHCFVGETLIETSEGQKRIDQIEIGDFVLTRKGFKKVKNVFNNGIREVAEYEINGRKLVCTDEHKVFTKNRGFVKSSQLTHSDKFIIFDEKESKWQNFQQKKVFFKSLTDLISVFIRPKSISKVGAKSMESRRRQPHTDTFGKRILAKFQKVFTFTTKTKTSQIIQSKILKLLTRNNIQNFTTIKNEPNYYGEILNNSHVQKRSNGTSQKKVVNGTSNIQDERFLVMSENLFVRIVKMILKPISKQRNIVPQNAKSNSIIGRKRRFEQVFDIEVEEEHEYFANGVLVHNCSDAVEYVVCEIFRDYMKEIN